MTIIKCDLTRPGSHSEYGCRRWSWHQRSRSGFSNSRCWDNRRIFMRKLDNTIGSSANQDQYANDDRYNPPGKWPFYRHRSRYHEFNARSLAEVIIGVGQVYHIQPEGVISGCSSGRDGYLYHVLLASTAGEAAFRLP